MYIYICGRNLGGGGGGQGAPSNVVPTYLYPLLTLEHVRVSDQFGDVIITPCCLEDYLEGCGYSVH